MKHLWFLENTHLHDMIKIDEIVFGDCKGGGALFSFMDLKYPVADRVKFYLIY